MVEVTRVLTADEQTAMLADGFLMERIEKAIADTERVAEFHINVFGEDCDCCIVTTWGPVILHEQPRPDWRHAVTKALDELEDIKQNTDPATDGKE